MTLDDFKDRLVIAQEIHYGRQLIYRFGDYGLSVLEEPIGAGPTFNAAIIKFQGANHIYDVDYTTGIVSSDVESNDERDIVQLLKKLKDLDR